MRKLILVFIGIAVMAIPQSSWAEVPTTPLQKQEWIREHFFLDRRGIIEERDEGTDSPEHIVDELKYEKLADIEEANLLSARLSETPWSDDYWPLYTGGIARRYSVSQFDEFNESDDWKKNYDHFIESTNSTSIDDLSPAEKYDLLMGDSTRALTKAMWDEGRTFYNSMGSVERWMGYCHGWAPAAYMMARPSNAVEVIAADGITKIKFFPADIKALATLLWAKAPGEVRSAGGRCSARTPDHDTNGRITDKKCFDTNPSTWHLAVVNQLGVSKRSLVIDATYDYQVWNQPLYSYSYSYYNVLTGKKSPTLADAIVQRSDYTNDPFKDYRPSRAAQIVGITMDITYVSETPPTHAERDAPSRDVTTAVTYSYDLELDRTGRVIGGEWHSNPHPDFLWTPVPNAKAMTSGDYYLETDQNKWNGRSPVPVLWQKVSRITATRGQPLARIVETLISLSQTAL